MMQIAAVLTYFPDLREAEVLAWVERGWVSPVRDGETIRFEEIDIARIRLVRDLRYGMAVEEETVPLVLSLLDQVYDLRHRMKAIARVVESQDERLRAAVLDALRG